MSRKSELHPVIRVSGDTHFGKCSPAELAVMNDLVCKRLSQQYPLVLNTLTSLTLQALPHIGFRAVGCIGRKWAANPFRHRVESGHDLTHNPAFWRRETLRGLFRKRNQTAGVKSLRDCPQQFHACWKFPQALKSFRPPRARVGSA